MADKVTVTTTILPGKPLEVGPQEATDLRRMGLLKDPAKAPAKATAPRKRAPRKQAAKPAAKPSGDQPADTSTGS